MLDPITAANQPGPGQVRSLVDRDEYGPLGGHGGGLFTVPVAHVVLLTERGELGHRLRTWVPDSDLL